VIILAVVIILTYQSISDFLDPTWSMHQEISQIKKKILDANFLLAMQETTAFCGQIMNQYLFF